MYMERQFGKVIAIEGNTVVSMERLPDGSTSYCAVSWEPDGSAIIRSYPILPSPLEDSFAALREEIENSRSMGDTV
jgi:hypothetical protein